MPEIRTQAEADAAVASGELDIHVYANVLLQFSGNSQPRVVCYGGSQPRVECYDSTRPRVECYDRSQPRVTCYDSSQPRVTCYGSSQPRVERYGSSQPRVQCYGYTMLSITGKAQVKATAEVRIRIDGGDPEVSGGVVHRVIPPTTPRAWAEMYGAVLTDDNTVTLYKAVHDDFRSAHGLSYAPGTVPIAPDWDGGVAECGGGLHFCATPHAAAAYDASATRFVACPVKLSDLAVVENPSYPNKIKGKCCCGPVYECDEDGEPLSPTVNQHCA